ncbi:MAG: hypothetical protein QOJ15_6968, partial [Bradyrhizobium sp.]|nr:hypothetical protein [Bradyrhizobium sp.]
METGSIWIASQPVRCSEFFRYGRTADV